MKQSTEYRASGRKAGGLRVSEGECWLKYSWPWSSNCSKGRPVPGCGALPALSAACVLGRLFYITFPKGFFLLVTNIVEMFVTNRKSRYQITSMPIL